jgi:hypothetical protein
MKQFYLSSLFRFTSMTKSLAAVVILLASSEMVFSQQMNARIADPEAAPGNSGSGKDELQLSFLPGTFVNWNITISGSSVELKWATTVENNSSSFVIEKSYDSKNFDSCGRLTAAHNSNTRINYLTHDRIGENINGLVYYRLRMVDMDGKFRYSAVRMIRRNGNDAVMLEVFPNPVVNDLKITVSNQWQSDKLVYEVYNSNGQLIKSRMNEKAGQIEVINVRDLDAGLYIVKVTNGSEASIKQFIKSNSTFHF